MSGFTDHVSAREPVDDDDDDADVAPAARPFERTTPALADVVPLALAAQQRGEAFVDVEMSGLGREWAPRVALVSARFKDIGIWGRVVARRREAPRGVDPRNAEAGIDSGPIARLLVRYGVMELLDAARREEIRRLTPQPRRFASVQRARPRNVMIR